MYKNSKGYKDLSEDAYSATSVFIRTIPQLRAIKNDSTLSNDEKLIKARQLVNANLSDARAASPYSISSHYISSYAYRLLDCTSVDAIIAKLRRSISCGKNYSSKNFN